MTQTHSTTDIARRRHVRAWRTIALCMLFGLLLTACGKGGSTRLSNSFGSPEKLLQRALQAVAEEDIAGLHALCITRYEHDSVLVPAMGKDSVDLDMAWFLLQANVDKGIDFVIEGYGGRSMEIEKVEFGGTEVYGSVTLHRTPNVTVTEPGTGERFEMTCFGTIVEEQGHFKLVSIRD